MMSNYRIEFARSARKELQAIPLSMAKRILTRIEILASKPRPTGCKKLRGHTNLWRIRVGEYRVIYGIDYSNYVIDISVIRHRSEAYN
jgi:mRNA interferase RelE/StbE